jgi:hypothetical protein
MRTSVDCTTRRRMQHGDVTSVAHAMHVTRQHVEGMISGDRLTPFERARRWTVQLRENGNPASEEWFLDLARSLGYVSYRIDVSRDIEALSPILSESADVVRTHAETEADGIVTPEERRMRAKEAYELAEVSLAYAHREEQMAAGRMGPKASRRIA